MHVSYNRDFASRARANVTLRYSRGMTLELRACVRVIDRRIRFPQTSQFTFTTQCPSLCQRHRLTLRIISSWQKSMQLDNCHRDRFGETRHHGRIEKQFRKADAPFILSPWGRAILPDNRGDKFHQDTLYTSHVCMKPAAYRSENNQSTPELIGRASWTIVAISLVHRKSVRVIAIRWTTLSSIFVL